MVQGRLPHLVHNYSDAASSREDPSRAASHAEPSAVATARAVATAGDDGESSQTPSVDELLATAGDESGVDELLANFVLEDVDEIHMRR